MPLFCFLFRHVTDAILFFGMEMHARLSASLIFGSYATVDDRRHALNSRSTGKYVQNRTKTIHNINTFAVEVSVGLNVNILEYTHTRSLAPSHSFALDILCQQSMCMCMALCMLRILELLLFFYSKDLKWEKRVVLVFIRHIYCIHVLFVVSCEFFFSPHSYTFPFGFYFRSFFLHFVGCVLFSHSFNHRALLLVHVVRDFLHEVQRNNCIKRRQRRAK